MDFQYVLLALFIAVMLCFIWFNRRKIQVQGFFPVLYFAMWRTSIGLGLMDRLACIAAGFWRVLFGIGVLAGFAGMVFICFELARNTILVLLSPGAVPGIQPVLPFQAKGVFFVPFVYWIICIFVIAAVHEFCHGIAARICNVPVKSAGLAFLGVFAPLIPAAFVEPDEAVLKRQGVMRQLGVFAAGPFSNLIMACIVLLLVVFIANPVAESMLMPGGIRITGIEKGSPAGLAGLVEGQVITAIDRMPVSFLENLTAAIKARKPGDTLLLETNGTTYQVMLAPNPKNSSLAYLGVFSRQHAEISRGFTGRFGAWSVPVILWVFGLVYWLFLLSLGIGLFNLLPIGPLDGGRMLQLALQKIFKQPHGQKVGSFISIMILGMVIANVIAGFL